METSQLRLELLDRIAVLEDASLLKRLLYVMDMEEVPESKLTEAEARAYQSALQEGIDDANAGNLVDFDTVKNYWQQRFANGK